MTRSNIDRTAAETAGFTEDAYWQCWEAAVLTCQVLEVYAQARGGWLRRAETVAGLLGIVADHGPSVLPRMVRIDVAVTLEAMQVMTAVVTQHAPHLAGGVPTSAFVVTLLEAATPERGAPAEVPPAWWREQVVADHAVSAEIVRLQQTIAEHFVTRDVHRPRAWVPAIERRAVPREVVAQDASAA